MCVYLKTNTVGKAFSFYIFMGWNVSFTSLSFVVGLLEVFIV